MSNDSGQSNAQVAPTYEEGHSVENFGVHHEVGSGAIGAHEVLRCSKDRLAVTLRRPLLGHTDESVETIADPDRHQWVTGPPPKMVEVLIDRLGQAR